MRKFKYAFTGLFQGMADTSILLQWMIVAVVTGFFLWLGITVFEWCLIVICFGVVMSMEYMNTLIEDLIDFQYHQFHPELKKIKDLGAGSVLVAAIMSLLVGIGIVLNHI